MQQLKNLANRPLRARATALLLALTLFSSLTLSSLALAQERVIRQHADAEAPTPVSSEEQKAVIDRIAQLLEQRYVFEDKGREAGQHIQKLYVDGAFESTTDPLEFARRITEALQSITNDKHMRVRALRPGAGGPGGPPSPSGRAPDPAERLRHMTPPLRDGNYGFEKVEFLSGNVGYLKLNGFASDPAAYRTATAAMNFLAGCDALIVDLRQNGGGNPEMIRYISSYLFDQPTHLNSLYWREGDRTEEFWTRTDVPGARVGQDVPMYVLTSGRTFSGGEEFAYNIQTQKRGRLIGETTGGGANPGGVVPVGDRFMIFIPTGRAINPITKTNWEGVGVKPDIDLPAEQAYDKAIELATGAASQRREKRESRSLELRQAVVDALDASAEQLKSDLDYRSDEVQGALEQAVAGSALDEAAINMAGYGYMEAGRLGEALALLRFNAARYPESANVHDSLGEALEKAGRLAEARDSYATAHELGIEQKDEQAELYKRNLDRVTQALSQRK